MQSEITPNDLVVFKEGNNIMSGGYKIDSLFLKNNIPPIQNSNINLQKGGDITSLFSNLAVPAGLLLLQQKAPKKNIQTLYEERKVVDSSLYDKLLDHVHKKKRIPHNRKTKVNKKSSSKKTTRKNT